MTVKTIQVDQLKQVLEDDPKALLIDIRELNEWQTGHIKQAQHIPMNEIEEKIKHIASSKHQPIFLLCRSGNRSLQMAQQLPALGYSNVTNVEGGILAWLLANYPIEQ